MDFLANSKLLSLSSPQIGHSYFELHTNEIIWHVPLRVWLLSLNRFLRFTRAVGLLCTILLYECYNPFWWGGKAELLLVWSFMNICEYVLVFICTYYVGYIPNSNTIRINEVSEVTEYNIKIQKVTVFLNTSTLIETKVWKKTFKKSNT